MRWRIILAIATCAHDEPPRPSHYFISITPASHNFHTWSARPERLLLPEAVLRGFGREQTTGYLVTHRLRCTSMWQM